ncbi:MAG: 50S ribosomal protein L32 [Caldisericia bacterium]|nr:50S ribosomal protein L32 [Caldisericia bacterium]MDD4614784.1 50S ribosomal protein L32 [Caldisericia bacterium]
MNVPKKKRTARRNNHRRAMQKLTPVQLTKCPSCNKLILPHNVCKYCGHYNNESIIAIKEKSEKSATA